MKRANELPQGKPRRYQKANIKGESETEAKVGVLNQKENKTLLSKISKSWKSLKENQNFFFGIVSLFVTIVYGAWGIHLSNVQVDLSRRQMQLSYKQDSTALDLLHFSQLLKKTDSVIILTKDQLFLNQKEQEKTNLINTNAEMGYMNKLLDKTVNINNKYLEFDRCYQDSIVSESSVRFAIRELEKLKILFVEEMNNPYLLSNDTIIQLWNHAYTNIGNLSLQLERSLIFLGKKTFNPITGEKGIVQLDTIWIENQFRKMNGDIFTSIGALGYIYVKIINEKIERGILDKNGKSKINPLDFYK